jgi:hypothetical protein
VAAADNQGRVRAYDLTSGSPVPGFGNASVGFGVRASLSSDGANVYVPVAVDGLDRVPSVAKFTSTGTKVWDSNAGTNLGSAWFQLSGMAVGQGPNGPQGWVGSSSQWNHSFHLDSGGQLWGFRNADSTMATPAIADMYGIGYPQVVMSTDTTAEFPADRNGGLLRIFTHDGRQICTAGQFVEGSTWAGSGYNNSSPAIAMVNGRPLIAFGSTGPTQFGAGGNQVVAYDAECRFLWASPDLNGRTDASVSFADVRGRGAPDVIEMVDEFDGSITYPRVYVLDSATGAIVGDTRNSLRAFGGALAYPENMSIVTADVNSDGAQDLFVPGRPGAFMVLDGRTLTVMTTIPTNIAIQNTPIVTPTATGVRITMAGYSGSGAWVSSYTSDMGTVGARGWTHFGGNPQLTGTTESIHGPYDSLIEGQVLGTGGALRSGGASATMQADGNFVVRDAVGNVRWTTGTNSPGSIAYLTTDGSLEIRSAGGAILWRWANNGSGVERATIGPDGVLRIYNEDTMWGTTRRMNTWRLAWDSVSGAPPPDWLLSGATLMPGQHLTSYDGRSQAWFQTDGNISVWKDGRLMWQSGTRDFTARGSLVMQSDGNLVIWDYRPWPIWATWTVAPGAKLVLSDDGFLRLVRPDGAIIWSTAPPPPPPPPPPPAPAAPRVK